MAFSNNMPYKGFYLFEKDGKYTVGRAHNADFDDCSLDTLDCGIDDAKLIEWNKQVGNEVVCFDMRSGKQTARLSFSSKERAKQFADWCIETLREQQKAAQKKTEG